MTRAVDLLVRQNWLSTLEGIADRVLEGIRPLLGSAAGGLEIGTVGAGGDRTLEMDRLAEDLILEELQVQAQQLGRFSVLSEEAGLVDLGADYPLVVVDPVDGSSNGQRGIRMVGVMLSLLNGPTLNDVVLGTTIDISSGQRWSAIRGKGAFRDGRPLWPMAPARKDRIEVLGLHALPSDLARAWPLLRSAATFRQLYCMSLSLGYTAAGGIDVLCSSRKVRVLDLTAGLLMIRQVAGVVTDLDGEPIDDLTVDPKTRTTLLCSAHPELHELALGRSRELASGTEVLPGG